MSVSARACSAPGSARPQLPGDHSTVMELNVPTESRDTQPVSNHFIPDELLLSLTSTVNSRSSTLGHAADPRILKGSGIRRPDAVWHHQLARKKYKFFLEQPTSLTGAGRDISFLCDAMVTQKKTTPLPPLSDRCSVRDTQDLNVPESLIPEEYHIVRNKGLRSLEFFEDAFTVQLRDDEQKLRVFPSLRPSGRLEVVQLRRMMDDMLEKAGVDQQSEELTELSQMEGLLELVQVEQKIYNIVFQELIRQVSVGCAERGQLLAKLRQRYQSLLERIPRRLKALHTEVVAQRALDRRLTEEIHHIKTAIQQLNTELSRIKDHDAFVSQQAEQAHRGLARVLEQTNTNSEVVQSYHELYELQRARLEAQLLQMTEEKDCWSQITFCLALKLISVKKLQLFHQLHVVEQSWFKTAEHCSRYLAVKDTKDLNVFMELTDSWKETLTAFISQLKKTEHAQCEQIRAIQRGIGEWLDFCTTQNKCPHPKYDKASLEKIHTDVMDWSNTLVLQCNSYQGERLLDCQQTLADLGRVQERWLNVSLELFKRHPSPDGEPRGPQRALRDLDTALSELLQQLDTQVSGENGIYGHITSLLGSIESQFLKLGAAMSQPDVMSVSDWVKLEKELRNWQSLAEKAFDELSGMQTEKQQKPNVYTETERKLKELQQFVTNMSNFTDGENHRLSKEVTSIYVAQTRWMLDLLLLTVPNHSEDLNHQREHPYMKNISPHTLDEDAKTLAHKLDFLSTYISSSCKLILEEQILQNPHDAEGENEMNECSKLQTECSDWVETSRILLSGVTGHVQRSDSTSDSDVPVSPADTMEAVLSKEVLAESTAPSDVKDETKEELREGELTPCESPVVKLINYDGNITERKLEKSSIHLNGTEEQVMSPKSEESQKAFSDLTTVALLQQELHDSELRVQSAEQRALEAEEALQAALEKIQDLERQVQGRPSLEPKSPKEKKKTPPPPSSPSPVANPTPPKKTTPETKPTSSTRKTRKR